MKRRVMGGNREIIEVVEELKSSGTWTVPAGCKSVDVFLVGGGGGGSGGVSGDSPGGSGGGSGYTKVIYKIAVTPGTNISYTIGKGGTGGIGDSSEKGGTGGYTLFMSSSYRANGGEGGCNRLNSDYGKGGDGGSGGGGADSGNGGSNGSNGGQGA